MRRRALLGSVAGLLSTALAGCTGTSLTGSDAAFGVAEAPTVSFEMTPMSDAELASRVLYTIQREDGAGDRADLLDDILDGGTSIPGTREPLPTDREILYEETIYRLSHEITERTPATRYSVKVDIVQKDSIPESKTVNFADLPKVDREIFAERGFDDGDTVGIGTTLLYTDEEREQSALVPESEYSYIVWENGNRAEWVVDDAYETEIKTFDYAAEQVDTAADYGRKMREQFAFELSDLSEKQVEIVETAIGPGNSETATGQSGYVVGSDETAPPEMVSLAEQFRDREHAHSLDEDPDDYRAGLNGSYLVRYEGEVYWTTLSVYGEQFETGSETTTAAAESEMETTTVKTEGEAETTGGDETSQ